MKTYKHLWKHFFTEENCKIAILNAVKHKCGNKQNKKTRRAKFYKEHYNILIPQLLDYAQHFQNATHKPIQIYDGIRRKQRTIIVPTLREQVIHHMTVNILKPIFMKSMYEHSYGSIPNRGSHLAKKRIEKWIAKDPENMTYCLKMDIKKYFDSVPHDILKIKFAKIIKDEKFLNLIYTIIDATDKGIPLGFYTSQWIANWYLTELDHYIKQELKAKYYVRYMDDMVIFDSDKQKLHKIRILINRYLREYLGLRLKQNWQVFLFDYIDEYGEHAGRDLDFMGFRFFRNKTILRRELMLKASRKARRIVKKQIITTHDCRQMLSYIGWINCTDTYNMYKKRIKPFVSIQKMKRYESKNQRRVNRNVVKKRKRRLNKTNST